MNDGLSEFSARLRRQREVSGRTLRQIAESTKLGVRTLEALERGDLTRLPPAIFRRAVVRAYAREIGLDAEQTLKEFLEVAPDGRPAPGATAQLVVEAARPARDLRRVMRQALRIAGLVALFIVGGIYFAMSRSSAAPMPDLPQLLEDTPHITPSARPEVRAVLPAVVRTSTMPGERPVVARISVSAPCHLLITADGQTVRDGRMAAGDLVEFNWRESLEIAGSDAGAVQFSLNGQAARAFGAPSTPLLARLDRADYQDFLVRP